MGYLKSCDCTHLDIRADVQFFLHFSLENCTKQDFCAIFYAIFKEKIAHIRIVFGYKSDWRHFIKLHAS